MRAAVRLKLTALYLLMVILGLALVLVPGTQFASADSSRTVVLLTTNGVVNPVMSRYVLRGLDEAKLRNAEALVIEMDTPGGLDSSMREMVQGILDSDVPVVVYVHPAGGRAASAGLFIAMSAHVAAMSPNTNIGSASPVSLGGPGGESAPTDETMKNKVMNDAVAYIRSLAERRGRNADWAERAVREAVNVPEREAVQLHVVELIASDTPDLLRQIDGRQVQLARGTKTLATADAIVVSLPMNAFEKLLHTISDPNIAYILLTIGMYGLIYELASPGAIVPGIVGVTSLVFAFFALGMLPINYAGLALIVFGISLLVAEVFVTPGAGIFAVGGLISMLAGSLILIDSASPYFQLSPFVIILVIGLTAVFFWVAIRAIMRTYRKHGVTGVSGMIGSTGVAQSALAPAGMIMVEGELWRARLEVGEVPPGATVRVVRLEGLTAVVEQC